MSSMEPSVVEPGNFFVRLFYIVVYIMILGIVRFVLWAVLLVQMVLHLVGAKPSVSYSTDEKPFPFNIRGQDPD